jgi:hypothetical protein
LNASETNLPKGTTAMKFQKRIAIGTQTSIRRHGATVLRKLQRKIHSNTLMPTVIVVLNENKHKMLDKLLSI